MIRRLPSWLISLNTLYILAYIILPFVAFWRNFDLSGLNLTFFHVDFIGYYYPDYVQGVQAVRHILSLKPISDIFWDPYNFLGFPLLGAVDRIGLFYPVRLLFYLITMVFPEKYWVFFATYYSLFHLTIAGIGTYLFVKNCLKLKPSAAFVAGIVYCFSGSLLFISIFTNVITGPALLPLQLYCMFRAFERASWKWAVVGGIVTAPLLLSGYTSTFIYNNLLIGLFLLLYFVRDVKGLLRLARYVVYANLLAVLLAAPVLLPSIELKQLALRQQLDVIGASGHSFTIDGLANYIAPYLFGLEKSGTVYGYIGMIPLILVFIAFKYSKTLLTIIAAGLAFVFFLLSTAHFTFLYDIFYKLLPFYSQFRFHSFLQYVVTFCLALLAAKGMSMMLDHAVSAEQATTYFKRFISVLILLLIIFTLLKTANETVMNIKMVSVVTAALTQSLLFIVGGFLVIHYGYAAKSKLVPLILTIIIVLDLFTLVSKTPFVNSTHDPRTFNSSSEVLQRYESSLKLNASRVYLHESTLRFNSAVENVYQIGGFHGLTPLSYSMLVDYYTQDFWIPPTSPLLDIWGTQYILTTRELTQDAMDTLSIAEKTEISPNDAGKFMTTNGTWIAPKTTVYVYENTDYVPRAHMAITWKIAHDDKQALTLMDETDLHQTAIITNTNNLPIPLFKQQHPPQATIDTSRSSYVKIHTISEDTALLVLSDLYYPGWVATVDGKPAPIHPVNIATRGVFVNGGAHTVEFIYRPWTLYAGVAIAGITLIAIAAIFFFSRKR